MQKTLPPLPMTPHKALQFPLRAGTLAIGVAVLVIGSYTLYAALPYLLGPSLAVSATTINGETLIGGTTERVSFLTIDGMAVPLQEDGSFSVERTYPLGYTAIAVSVRDRFGRTATKMLTFLNPVP
ncbi:MAG: hypothetical protein Q7R74_00670 [bacterium]|nr:hypothetical protein [bacterium]